MWWRSWRLHCPVSLAVRCDQAVSDRMWEDATCAMPGPGALGISLFHPPPLSFSNWLNLDVVMTSFNHDDHALGRWSNMEGPESLKSAWSRTVPYTLDEFLQMSYERGISFFLESLYFGISLLQWLSITPRNILEYNTFIENYKNITESQDRNNLWLTYIAALHHHIKLKLIVVHQREENLT